MNNFYYSLNYLMVFRCEILDMNYKFIENVETIVW